MQALSPNGIAYVGPTLRDYMGGVTFVVMNTGDQAYGVAGYEIDAK